MVVILDGQAGLGCIFLTLVFFQTLKAILCSLPLPVTVSQVHDEFRIFRWQNLLVSWIHAVITGFTSVISIFAYWREMNGDMMNFVNWPFYFVGCFSTGYFIYDTIDILLAGRMKEKWEILVHHIAIVIAACYTILSVHAMGFHVLSMCIEMNTVFLHLRKLMQMARWARHYPLTMQTIVVVNLVTFVLFRLAPLGMVTVAIFHHYHEVPVWFLFEFAMCMFALNVINCVLFYRLIKTDFVSRTGSIPQQKASDICVSMDMEETVNRGEMEERMYQKQRSHHLVGAQNGSALMVDDMDNNNTWLRSSANEYVNRDKCQ